MLWGLFGVGAGLVYARTGAGVLELVNLIGSAFYGPILAVFVLGVGTRGVTGTGAVSGLAAGLAANVLLAGLLPDLSWLWWNPAGFAVAAAVALVVSPRPIALVRPSWRPREGVLLLTTFGIILGALLAAPALVRGFAGH